MKLRIYIVRWAHESLAMLLQVKFKLLENRFFLTQHFELKLNKTYLIFNIY
jgi:hypothetical protein